ncbi:MAG: toprim domain-containing protein, partial [Chloroflexota bacterium]
QGYQQQDLLDAGLLKHNQERSSTYDAFRNRLMIPIQDRQGRTIGFGGRVLDKSLPKYLNTAETPLFHKSHVVYGIDLAHTAIRDTNQVVIVEGYMDVIAAHQYGYRNVVACMGTALTSQQLQQLQRYTDNYVLALDADNAGQQATVRGLNQARQALSKTRKPTLTPTGRIQLEERLAANLSIASMPEGRDPDDIIRQDYTAGTQQWPTIVQQALPLVDFYFNIIAEQVDLKSAQGKGVAVAELTPLIAELGDEIEHHHYIQKLSRLVQIDEVTIAARVQAAAKTVHVNAQGHNQPRRSNGQQRQISPRSPTIQASVHAENRDSHKATLSGQSVSSQPTPQTLYHESQIEKSGSNNAVQPVDRGPLSTENYLLAHLLRQPDLLVWLAESSEQLEISSLEPKDFVSIENQGIFRQLKKFITSDDAWDLELFQETLAEQLHGHLAQLVVYGLQLPETNVRALREDIARIMLRLRLQNLNEAETRIKYLLAEAQERNDREFIRSFGAIRNQNLRELYHLQRVFGNLNQYLVRPEKSSTIPNTASNITVNM